MRKYTLSIGMYELHTLLLYCDEKLYLKFTIPFFKRAK